MTSQEGISHSRLYRVLLWSAAVAVIVVGVYLSNVRFMNSEWLSRAGCLVVMLGIWSGLGGIVQERVLSTRMRWQRRNARVRARAKWEAEGFDAAEIDKKLDEIDEAFEKRFSDLTQKLKLSLGTLEVSLLMTGTFLWGFGDLFVA